MTKKNLAIIISIFLIGLLTIVGSYSFLSWISNTNKNIVFNTAKNVSEYVVYDPGTSGFEGNFQISDDFKDGIHTTISIKKTAEAANIDLFATINMTINQIGNTMKTTPGLKWVVTEGNSSVTNPVVLSTGNFLGTNNGDDLELYPNIEVTLTEEEYTIWIWIDASENPPSSITGETLNVDIWTEIEQFVKNRFEITQINGVYPTITATAVNSNKNITNYAVTTAEVEPTTWETIPTASQKHVYNLSYNITTTGSYYVWFKDSGNTVTHQVVSVSKRPITITAKAQTINYGSSIAIGVDQVTINTYTSVSGLATGHSLDAITLTPSISNPGTGTITPSAATIENATITSNYNITYATSVLTIVQPQLTGGSVAIIGVNKVGQTLTASITAPNPTPTSYTYQWYINTSASTSGGTAISGATSNTFTLTSTQLGKYIYVVVTAKKDNYNNKLLSDLAEATNNSFATVAENNVPVISLATNSSTSHTKTKSVTVNVTDSGTGLKTNQQVKYGWSLSNTTEPSTYTEVTLTNTAGATSTSFNASSENELTGQYYLWVVPNTNVCDVANNCTTTAVKSTGLFYFDNSVPKITSVTSSSYSVEVTATDNHSGINQYYYGYKEYTDGATCDGVSYTSNLYNNYTIVNPIYASYLICIYVTDNAENMSEIESKKIGEDFFDNNWVSKAGLTDLTNNIIAVDTQATLTTPNTYTYNGNTYTKIGTVDVSESNTNSIQLSKYSLDNTTTQIVIFSSNGKIKLHNTDAKPFSNKLQYVQYMNLSNMDSRYITDMSYMFFKVGNNATTFSLNLSGWDTSSVTTMNQLFYNAGYNATTWSIGDISGWDTSSVTNMSGMFIQAGYSATT